MIDSIKNVVPKTYWSNHLGDSMRQTEFMNTFNGVPTTFNVLTKVDARFSPRDLGKLKGNLRDYSKELARDPLIVPNIIVGYLMAATYEKQIVGMGKPVKFLSYVMFYFHS